MARIAFILIVLLAMIPVVTMLPSHSGSPVGKAAIAVPLAIRG
jgi:hypothetical protein